MANLSLSRNSGESIDINGGHAAGGITITVARISGRQVRLTFSAPEDVIIHRREIQLLVDAAQAQAPPPSCPAIPFVQDVAAAALPAERGGAA